MEVSQDNIKMAQFVAKAIGVKPQVYPYWDNANKNSIDILDLEDPLNNSIKFYSSVGLSDYPNIIEMKSGDQNIPVEILFASNAKYDKVPNILASCCFYIMKDKWTVQPGTVFKDIVADYYPSSDMKHIFFTRPFFWQDKLSELKLDKKSVNWLLGVPISNNELTHKLDHGVNSLEKILFGKQLDHFDAGRESFL